ncbi:aspartate dehydrogenase [Variovorax sp. PCZ-1]|uniref:aspartate dehydrogenase n=1 Tax=Variovorax sp. PCZ-1 TaxID=2835533 RepID=UPI001BCFEA0D|nr:aspartate dehydrogenase [Variovorax sp. PCZ-1]MBS7808806.1 aspartate dehydrogenase [Variovorax sp. PCZ-1]
MSTPSLNVCLIGYGAIGQAIVQRIATHSRVKISHIVVRSSSVVVPHGIQAVNDVPPDAQLVLECAGHSALHDHVLPALQRGIDCAVLSVGALSEVGLPEALAQAARVGGAQLHLLPGAIGGIDAIAAAKQAGLTAVRYTGRKPPLAWKGTPAEKQFDLKALADTAQSATIFEASAREAAAQYPKNANVAATISLAGLGLDATQVRLIADGSQTENVHEIEMDGAFGKMKLEMRNQPLPDNPKTSMLTVLSALRFLENRAAGVVI